MAKAGSEDEEANIAQYDVLKDELRCGTASAGPAITCRAAKKMGFTIVKDGVLRTLFVGPIAGEG